MHLKLDYFYFLAFELEVKVTEILKYILLLSRGERCQERGTDYQVLGKY